MSSCYDTFLLVYNSGEVGKTPLPPGELLPEGKVEAREGMGDIICFRLLFPTTHHPPGPPLTVFFEFCSSIASAKAPAPGAVPF